jgi:hypothetical protein
VKLLTHQSTRAAQEAAESKGQIRALRSTRVQAGLNPTHAVDAIPMPLIFNIEPPKI